MSVQIRGVEPHSLSSRHGVHAGDTLISINEHEIFDVLDYRFYLNERKLVLRLRKTDGKEKKVTFHKKEQQDIGLLFDTYLMDKQQQCKNKCIFCFVDQMPMGLRNSLYFKDDDSRLSFLFGNYITLTALSEREAERIIQMHISPVNVSVHTMNPTLRVQMMKNPKAGESLKYLERFADAGIRMNTQLVLCPGINDGKELSYSLERLSALYPAVQSVAAVPVGLTRFREGLCILKPYDKQTASEVLDITDAFGEAFLKENGTRFIYAADEFYIKAERVLPESTYYEDFPQLDNGVGLCRLLEDEFFDALQSEELLEQERSVSIATGVAAFPLMEKLCRAAEEKFPKLRVMVYPIVNDFFGHSVTVSGLVTGQDLYNQLSGKALGQYLLIPLVMLRKNEDVFLDDMRVSELSEKLGVPITAVENSGFELLSALLGKE